MPASDPCLNRQNQAIEAFIDGLANDWQWPVGVLPQLALLIDEQLGATAEGEAHGRPGSTT